MSDRLPSSMLVSALLRRVNDAGGMAVVRARGDAQGGAILLVVSEAGGPERVVERGIGGDGRAALIDSTPAGDVDGYWHRRRARDPALWVVALDVARATRICGSWNWTSRTRNGSPLKRCRSIDAFPRDREGEDRCQWRCIEAGAIRIDDAVGGRLGWSR